MKRIVFRVRKEYFDAIVRGEKTVEYRKVSPYWFKRLCTREPLIAVFMCGKRIHRRRILRVEEIATPSWFSEQGRRDVCTETCLAVYLGAEASE